jgi:hypothetical protein
MLSNLIATSPEALAAQKEQKKADQTARNRELERLRGLLDNYTNEKKIKNLLPEDVESMKKFLKNRISVLQASPTMTEIQLLTLKGNKESQNYDNLNSSIDIRAKFINNLNKYKNNYNAAIEDLKKKSTPIPDVLKNGVKISDEGITWAKKNQFETPDSYDDKQKELAAKFEATSNGIKFGNTARIVKSAEENRNKERDTFSILCLIKQVAAYVGGYSLLFLIATSMLLGSSLAVNLNLHKNWAFRLLYTIYGAIFCFIVIPYVLLYRWAWQGHRPKFYSLIPLFPYHWNGRLAQILLGWMSYRPDDEILALREWEKESAA